MEQSKDMGNQILQNDIVRHIKSGNNYQIIHNLAEVFFTTGSPSMWRIYLN